MVQSKGSGPGLSDWEVQSSSMHWCLLVMGFSRSLCGEERSQEVKTKEVPLSHHLALSSQVLGIEEDLCAAHLISGWSDIGFSITAG